MRQRPARYVAIPLPHHGGQNQESDGIDYRCEQKQDDQRDPGYHRNATESAHSRDLGCVRPLHGWWHTRRLP